MSFQDTQSNVEGDPTTQSEQAPSRKARSERDIIRYRFVPFVDEDGNEGHKLEQLPPREKRTKAIRPKRESANRRAPLPGAEKNLSLRKVERWLHAAASVGPRPHHGHSAPRQDMRRPRLGNAQGIISQFATLFDEGLEPVPTASDFHRIFGDVKPKSELNKDRYMTINVEENGSGCSLSSVKHSPLRLCEPDSKAKIRRRVIRRKSLAKARKRGTALLFQFVFLVAAMVIAMVVTSILQRMFHPYSCIYSLFPETVVRANSTNETRFFSIPVLPSYFHVQRNDRLVQALALCEKSEWREDITRVIDQMYIGQGDTIPFFMFWENREKYKKSQLHKKKVHYYLIAAGNLPTRPGIWYHWYWTDSKKIDFSAEITEILNHRLRDGIVVHCKTDLSVPWIPYLSYIGVYRP